MRKSKSAYHYDKGFKPYRDLSKLTPRVKRIITMLIEKANMSEIARQVGVSRCFVWQVSHRLKATKEKEKKVE